MGKSCIQCGKKIGMFQKAVDEIYCSLDCAAVAQKEIAEKDRQAQVQRVEAQRLADEQAEQDEARRVEELAAEKLLRTCPKCGSDWAFRPATDPGGVNAGQCSSCAFTAEFTAIEKCPSCAGVTLVQTPTEGAYCPRCKYRQ